MKSQSFTALVRDVEEAGGLLEVTVERLRDCVGAGKLGVHVRDEIWRSLKRSGLIILGGVLPNDQRNTVWLIAPQTEGGQLMLDTVEFIRLERWTRPDGSTGEAA